MNRSSDCTDWRDGEVCVYVDGGLRSYVNDE
jgi:hypothetical protein